MTSARPPSELLAAGAATVTVVLWASAFVSIRSAGEAYSPGALALGRLLVGRPGAGRSLLVRREGLPPRAAWPGIAVSGLLWFGCYMVVLNWGEQQVDAGTAALVVNVGPILIALLGGPAARGARCRPGCWPGMAVSFAGAVIVGAVDVGRRAAPRCSGWCCACSRRSAYAGGVVAQKPALRHGRAPCR